MTVVRIAVLAACLFAPAGAWAEGLGISKQQVIDALTAPGEIAAEEFRIETRGSDEVLIIPHRGKSGPMQGDAELEVTLVGPATNLKAVWVTGMTSKRAAVAAQHLLSVAAPSLGAPPESTDQFHDVPYGARWIGQFFREAASGLIAHEFQIQRHLDGRRFVFENLAGYVVLIGVLPDGVDDARTNIYVRSMPADPQVKTVAEAIDRTDYVGALARLKPLAEAGNAEAQVLLGDCYHAGRGVLYDFESARAWYQKAADGGAIGGYYGLAVLESYGIQRYKSAKAASWFLKAALAGHPSAQVLIGKHYAAGGGVPRSDVEAGKWYEVSARLGHIAGQMAFAEVYAKGWGRPSNPAQAFYWYSVALSRLSAQSHFRAVIRQDRNKIQDQLPAEQRTEIEGRAERWQPQPFEGICAQIACPAELLAQVNHASQPPR